MNPVTCSTCKTRLVKHSAFFATCSTRSTLPQLAVLIYLLVVLVFSPVVLACPFICPFVVLVCPLVVSACPLAVPVVLPVGLFITDPIYFAFFLHF